MPIRRGLLARARRTSPCAAGGQYIASNCFLAASNGRVGPTKITASMTISTEPWVRAGTAGTRWVLRALAQEPELRRSEIQSWKGRPLLRVQSKCASGIQAREASLRREWARQT